MIRTFQECSLDQLIALLNLEPLPHEGGYYREIYRSPLRIDNDALERDRYGPGHRCAGSIIYFVMTHPHGFSAMHQVRTPETFIWLAGDPYETLLLHPDGNSETIISGPDTAAGQQPVVTIDRDIWQGSRVLPVPGGKEWTLITATLSPGFEWEDFKLGSAKDLCEYWPAAAEVIRGLVRT